MTRLINQSLHPWPPAEIIERAFNTERRVLLFGQPGIGKSTYASGLARTLGCAGAQLLVYRRRSGLTPFRRARRGLSRSLAKRQLATHRL